MNLLPCPNYPGRPLITVLTCDARRRLATSGSWSPSAPTIDADRCNGCPGVDADPTVTRLVPRQTSKNHRHKNLIEWVCKRCGVEGKANFYDWHKSICKVCYLANRRGETVNLTCKVCGKARKVQKHHRGEAIRGGMCKECGKRLQRHPGRGRKV
jgi:hypothetical protein